MIHSKPTILFGFLAVALMSLAISVAPTAPAQQTLVDICDRTDQLEQILRVQAGDGTAVACDAIPLAYLQSLSSLDLSATALTAASLTTLTSLQSGDLAGMSQLQSLDLSDNTGLTALPDGLFSGITTLTALDLSGTGATLNLQLQSGGLQRVRARLAAAAPTALKVPVTSNDGALVPSLLTIAAGATLSTYATLVPTTAGTAGSITIPSDPATPTGFDVTWALGNAVTTALGICDRTAAVQTALIAQIGGSLPCAQVTLAQLQTVTGTINLSSQTITALTANDFAGLVSITGLNLSSNSIASLPAGLFRDLSNLRTLNLAANSLAASVAVDTFRGAFNLRELDLSGITALPPGALAGLGNLQKLTINNHSLTSIEDWVFADLGSLQTLDLGTRLSGATGNLGLSAASFAGLTQLKTLDLGSNRIITITDSAFSPLTNLTTLDLSTCGLTSVGSADFAGLDALQNLYLGGNNFATVPAPVFSALGNLQVLQLQSSGLTSLPPTALQGLTSLQTLHLNDNSSLTTLDAGTFGGLASLQTLWIQSNGLTSVAPTTFTGLTSLQTLQMHGNSGLTTLDAGTFAGLTSLQTLTLNNNGLTALPANLFAGLSNLQTLTLNSNVLTTNLPANIFNGLRNLNSLNLSANTSLAPLPEDLFSHLANLRQLNLQNTGLTSLGTAQLDGLRSLQDLNLQDNSLTSLAPGIFFAFDNLQVLNLDGNKLTALPDDTFRGLTQLQQVLVTNNGALSNSNITVALNLVATDASTIQLHLPIAAPVPVTITATATNGTLSLDSNVAGSASLEVLLDAGDTLSQLVHVTASGSTTPSISIAAPDFNASSIRYARGLTPQPSASVSSQGGICARNAAIVTELLAAINVVADPDIACDAVTTTQLTAVTALDLSSKSITGLTPADLSGLTGLKTLNLSGNSIAALSADHLQDLTALITLNLSDNQLPAMQAAALFGDTGIFSPLTSIETLNVSGNPGALHLPSLSLHRPSFNRLSVRASHIMPANWQVSLTPKGVALPQNDQIIPAGEAASATITTVPDHTFNGDHSVEILTPQPPTGFSGFEDITLSVAKVSIQVGICDRTMQVRAALVRQIPQASDCSGVTLPMLQALALPLELRDTGITSLKAIDFVGLDSLTEMRLSNNSLQSLPAGIFDPLASLLHLGLADNELASLPNGLLSNNTRLLSLRLQNNQLDALPNGFFTNITAVTEMSFANNPGAPFPLLVQLTLDQNADTLALNIPLATPVALQIPLQLTGAEYLHTTTPVVAIAAGTSGIDPMAVTLPPGGDNKAPFQASVGTLPTLPDTFVGLVLASAVNDSADGICARSLAVRNAIVAAINDVVTPDIDCSTVTAAAFANVTKLNLSSSTLTAVQSGDFADLSMLASLNLSGNELTSLPAGIFADLAALTTLNLNDNALTSLPSGVFSGTQTLGVLNLSNNMLTALEADTFAGLVRLITLTASDNRLASLPAGLLSGLGYLQSLNLTSNPGAPFELPVELTLLSATQIEAQLPLPIAAGVEIYTQDNTQVAASTVTAFTPPSFLAVGASANWVRITNICFNQTSADSTGTDCADGLDKNANPAFQGIALVAPAQALTVESHPSFAGIEVADQSYQQQITIQDLQLPEADFRRTARDANRLINMTYSLAAVLPQDSGGTLDGDLPAGLSFDVDTRTLAGAPTAAGIYSMTYSVADDNGDTASLAFMVVVTGLEGHYEQLHAQILSHFAITVADSAGQAVSDRIDRMVSAQKPRLSTNRDGSQFEIPLSRRSAWSLWMQQSYSELEQSAGQWNWDGQVTGQQVGLDWRSAGSTVVLGMMVQDSDGKFTYGGAGGQTRGLTGYYDTPMETEHYYFGWAPRGKSKTSWLNFWYMSGTGTGTLEMSTANDSVMMSDTDMDMTHFGLTLVPFNKSRGLRLRMVTENSTASLNLKASPGINALEVEVTRERFLLEPSTASLISGDHQKLTLAAELGMRSDSTTVTGASTTSDSLAGLPDGDSEEVGVKMHYSYKHIDVEMGFRQVEIEVDTEKPLRGKYEESGYFASFTLASRADERGLAVSLTPAWGNSTSSLQQLWNADQISQLSNNQIAGTGSMQAEVSYGMFAAVGGGALFTPYSRLRTSDNGAADAAFGMRLDLKSGLDLNLEYRDKYVIGGTASALSNSLTDNLTDNKGALKLGGKLSF